MEQPDVTPVHPPEQRSEGLSPLYTVGILAVSLIYAGLAALGAILNADAEGISDPEVAAGFLQGQLIGYFGCCMSVPLFLSVAIGGLIALVQRGPVHLTMLKTLFWVTTMILPFVTLSILLGLLTDH